jgi:hypothetical protein
MTLRFGREAKASLAVFTPESSPVGVDEVFDALSAKRLMLRVTQQLAEWGGPKSGI